MSQNFSRRETGHRFRPTVRLSVELEKTLSAYATAALAAGVGLIAVAEPANAKIVYTPANVPIPPNGGPVYIDLNHDGIPDFILSNFFQSGTESRASFASLLVSASFRTQNQVWGRGIASSHGRARFASALFSGVPIGPNKLQLHRSPTALMAGLFVGYAPWAQVRTRANSSSSTCLKWIPGCVSSTEGQWMYTKNRYLGLQFEIKGELHYGWARFDVTRAPIKRGSNTITARLTGYAYETDVKKPIVTGQTMGPDVATMPEDADKPGLGMLAAGRK